MNEDQLSKNQQWYLNTTTLRGQKRVDAVATMLGVKTVGDLTDDHRGWQVNISDDRSIKGYRTVDFDGVRTWEYEGRSMAGVLCKEYDKPYKHSERAYRADTPCELLWQSRKPKGKRK